MVKLSKKQLELVIRDQLSEENGLNELFKMTLEGLMYYERQAFLSTEPKNKGNGYRPKNSLGFGKGFKLSVPRDRIGVFKPYILELLQEDNHRIREACFELYSKGLTNKDVGQVIETLYGKSYSESSISTITKGFYKEMEQWRTRVLEANWAAIYIDAIFVKVRRDTVQSEAFYVLLGLKDDMIREVLGIYNYPTERASAWTEIAQDIKSRGVKQVNLFISDGLSGIEEALKQVFPTTPLQTCTLHYKRNILKKIRPSHKAELAQDLKAVFNPHLPEDSVEDAKQRLRSMADKWEKVYPKISDKLREDAAHNHILFEYVNYDFRVRAMLYTTNWIERLNKSFRKTLKVRGSLPSIESALVLMTKVAVDMGEGTYSYKISNFKDEPKLFDFT